MEANMEKQGVFLVFVGGEGSGKTTQVELLRQWMFKNSNGRDVLVTKEPGGNDEVCVRIRELLLDPKYKDKISPRAELLLFEADRAQHVDSVIRLALFAELSAGKVVICDRFSPETFAYQCVGRNVTGPVVFKIIDDFATQKLQPDFIFWLDIDPEVGLKRNVGAGKRDRFEMESLPFHKRVREGFEGYFEKHFPKERWQKYDATLPLEEIHRQIVETITSKRLV